MGTMKEQKVASNDKFCGVGISITYSFPHTYFPLSPAAAAPRRPRGESLNGHGIARLIYPPFMLILNNFFKLFCSEFILILTLKDLKHNALKVPG